MVDWKDPKVLRTCQTALELVAVGSLGIFVRYFAWTFDHVERRLLTGRLKFSWLTHLPYLAGRYAFVLSTTCLIVILRWSAPSALNCGAMMWIMVVTGCLTVVASSMNMVSRLPAVWGEEHWNHYVYYAVMIALMAHIALAIAVPFTGVHGYWDADLQMCKQEADQTGQKSMVSFYAYTVLWDFVILVLTLAGLRREQSAWTSPIGVEIRRQGIYFILFSLFINVGMVFLIWQDYNMIMDIMLAIPGGAANVIASSFLVTSFINNSDKNSQRHGGTHPQSGERKTDGTTVSTIIDLTEAYISRTSSDTHDARFSGETSNTAQTTDSDLSDTQSSSLPSYCCSTPRHSILGDDIDGKPIEFAKYDEKEDVRVQPREVVVEAGSSTCSSSVVRSLDV